MRHASPSMLTGQQERILRRLVADAPPNKVIAYELGVSEGAIKNHLTDVMKKLNLGNRTALALWAVRNLAE